MERLESALLDRVCGHGVFDTAKVQLTELMGGGREDFLKTN